MNTIVNFVRKLINRIIYLKQNIELYVARHTLCSSKAVFLKLCETAAR